MNRRAIAIGACTLAAVVAGGFALMTYGLPSAGSSHRVILPDQTMYGYYHSTYWAVSREDAKRADAGVRDFLLLKNRALAAKFDGYYGQIIGVERAGRRLVHLNYFCAGALSHEDDYPHIGRVRSFFETPSWKSALVEVEDGGDCYFSVDFDPATGAYVNFFVNGDA